MSVELAARNLTPAYFLERLNSDRPTGALAATCLVVDISGFTPLTTQLMQHGPEGAEVIAAVLAAVFEPLVAAVFRRGGFLAGFAGDAFKAVFPGAGPEAARQAGRAAWEMQALLAANAVQNTRFGAFRFTGKVAIASGSLAWHIWQADPAAHASMAQRAAGFFTGEALDRCMQADPFAQPGAILATAAVWEHLRAWGADGFPVDQYWQVSAWPADELIAGVDTGSDTHSRAPGPTPEAQAQAFFPLSLRTSPVEGEFRRVVSLFVNCPALPDPAAEAQFAAQLFALLARCGGYLCRIGRVGGKDSGITLLIFFGAPTGYEHDVQSALNFILDLQQAVAAPLRAGITTNIAFAGFVGAPQFQEYTCHGQYVNLAARQMVAAAAGEIWLDGETAQHAGADFTVLPLGEVAFKGFRDTQPVFRLVGRRAETAPLYQGRLVGRQRELDLLLTAVHPILRGRFGGAVFVVGEPGMGKSRLLHELAQRLVGAVPDPGERVATGAPPARSPHAVAWYVCKTDQIVREPLNPFRYWLRRYFNQTVAVDAAANLASFTLILDRAIAATADPPLAVDLERSRSFLAALLDLELPDSLHSQLDPQLRFENTLDAIKALVKAESLHQSVVLQVEDVQWLDPESITCLAHLAHNVDGFPFLIVAAARPEGEYAAGEPAPAWLGADLPRTTVRLAALGPGELESLLAERLGAPPAPRLLSLVIERAEGNPFFAEQLLLYLQEHGLLAQQAGQWDLGSDPAQGGGDVLAVLPGDVRSVLTARLDRLPLDVKLAVQTAAVLGREFDTRVLAAMLARDASLERLLAAGERASMWTPSAAMRYLFRHALLRDAAYDMPLRAQRRKLHLQAAAAIERVFAANLEPHYASLAHHFRQGEDAPLELHYARLAGSYAAGLFANQDAVRHFTRALELVSPSQPDLHVELRLAREQVNYVLGARTEQAADLEELAALVDAQEQPLAFATYALQRARFYELVRNYGEALQAAHAAYAAAQTAGAADLAARSQQRLGDILIAQGRYAEAEVQLDAALEICAGRQDRRGQADLLYLKAHIPLYQGRLAEALPLVERASALYATSHEKQGEARCLHLFGQIHWRLGHFTAALEYYQEALASCQAIGWDHFGAVLLGALGDNSFELGDYAAAHAYHLQALRQCRELQDREGEAISLDTLGLIDQVRGSSSSARVYFQAALEIAEAIGDLRCQGAFLTHLGYALAQAGELAAAGDAFASAIAVRRTLGSAGLAIDSLAGEALVQHARRDLAAAQASVNAILDWIDANGVEGIELPVPVLLICYRILAANAGSDPAQAARAAAALAHGRAVILARAEQIEDAELRRCYLENGYGNAELLALWDAQPAPLRTETARDAVSLATRAAGPNPVGCPGC